MLTENWQMQADEIQALESIYGEADFRIVAINTAESSNSEVVSNESQVPPLPINATAISDMEPLPEGHPWALHCQLSLHLETPPSGAWDVILSFSGGEEEESAAGGMTETPLIPRHRALHLPPITLELQLGPNYPSEGPPGCHVAAMWLSRGQAVQLEAHLAEIWAASGPGIPVIFDWAEWLQNEAAYYLQTSAAAGLGNRRAPAALLSSSSSFIILESGPSLSPPEEEENGGAADGGVAGDELEEEALQLRASQARLEARLVGLLRYSAAREAQLFRQAHHACGVCLEEHRGTQFVRLDCHHAFCADCLRAQAQVHVGDGSLDALRCPEPGCREPLAVHVLRALLSSDEFERWEQLTLQRALDAMSDAAYCPRCGTLSLEDPSDNCADCPKCLYVFCTLCQEGRHPAVQCVSAETKLEMLRKKAEGGGAAAVAELRRKEHEMMSLAVIEKSSKPCPCCSMAIERSEGCNKMVCGQCGAFFCYKCGKQITGYEHFRAGGGCVLFDEAEILRWERRWEEQVGGHAAAAYRNDYLGEFGGGDFGGAVGEAVGERQREPLPMTNCPSCGQPNYKFARNNHMQCWSCTRHFCAVCRTLLPRRGGGVHFGPGGCKQHS